MAHTFELGTDGPSRILVGIDGSETSVRAGAYAFGMARRNGSRLIVLYVETTSALAAGLTATAGVLHETHEQIAAGIETQLNEVVRQNGVDAAMVRRRGNPYLELIHVAEELRVDAIVVGASMQAGHRLVGSLAGRLVRDAKWPVTVVP